MARQLTRVRAGLDDRVRRFQSISGIFLTVETSLCILTFHFRCSVLTDIYRTWLGLVMQLVADNIINTTPAMTLPAIGLHDIVIRGAIQPPPQRGIDQLFTVSLGCFH